MAAHQRVKKHNIKEERAGVNMKIKNNKTKPEKSENKHFKRIDKSSAQSQKKFEGKIWYTATVLTIISIIE